MGSYIVTAGHVTVETAVPGGRAHIDVFQGSLLPDDVPQEQIDHELRLGTIEPVGAPVVTEPTAGADVPPPGELADPEGLPEGMSVAATLTWVGDDRQRAQVALNSEQGPAGKGRSTLVDRLEAVIGS